jgi:glutathione S-transferase
MIEHLRLYQIPGSHFCDKVRWALDLKDIPYELINYNIFGTTKGLERAPKTISKLMPTLEDPNSKDNNQFRCESTPILIYLDTEYPQSSLSLFPSSPEQRQRVIDTCFRLDSGLGLYARRLAYVQILNEKQSVLSILLGEKFSWAYNPDDIRSRLISPFIACLMISRCRLHRIREDQLREKMECILLEFGDHLRTNDYLVGEHFSAADLTFCSLVKPLQRVPCFRDDRRFRIIFDYHERIRQKFDPKYPNIDNFIEKMTDQHRAQVKKNEKSLTTRIRTFIHRINFVQQFFSWIMTLAVSRIYGPASDEKETPQFKIPSPSHDEQQHVPVNDQRVANFTSKWSAITFLFRYLCHLAFTIPRQAAYLNEKT